MTAERFIGGRPGGDVDGEAIISSHWPYDGPHTEEQIREAAAGMAHLARYLNNATQGYNGAGSAMAASAVIDSISTTIYRLDQLLGQLARGARHNATDPTLYDTEGNSAETTALDLAVALDGIRQDLKFNHRHLDKATALASRLEHRSPR